MYVPNILCALFIALSSVSGEDLSATQTELINDSQKTLQQEWRAVDYYSPPAQEWTPEVTPKRRRLRKRKRRPEQRMPEPWEESEDNQKTYHRRRTSPVFEPSEKIRDPYTALAEAEEKQKKESDLKTVLKQTGASELSLIEILQQKNLSLSELLTGNKQVIAALTENTSRRNFQKSEEEPSSTEVVEPEKRTTARSLPVTNAKIFKKTPLRPVTISIDQVFGFSTTTSGPLRMVIDLESKPKAKISNVTAEDELMELLKDPLDRQRLSRILQSRNMTVEELVAQRERGSSQVHLADIFHNKTREPEPPEHVIHEGKIVTAPPPVLVRQQKSSKNMTSLNNKKVDEYTITSFPTFKIEHKMPTSSTPIPEMSQTSSTTHFYENFEKIQEIDDNHIGIPDWQRKTYNDYELNDEESFLKFPTNVKSAILASFAIVGLSLLVFMTILLIFRWSQKRKQRLNGSVLSSKMLASEQRRSFKSFVCETLGRRKNYYKSHLNSMSDTIWNDSKKSYMI